MQQLSVSLTRGNAAVALLSNCLASSFFNVCHEKFEAEPKEEDEEWSTLQIKCSVAATSIQQACIIQDSTVAVNTGHCKSC